ncbi:MULTISPECIES: hypothetical protein [unclassified Nocardiopsis]|uniref:endonuclease/exonuclease/phosphatase family protein n=1 Tax=unclassified Nocardiopsis TaxID=2649073 RepID=UPI00135C802B|nr:MULTISPECIES: hypothetical protein [unclassified Nocardiopsis]
MSTHPATELPVALINLDKGLEKGQSLHLLDEVMAPCAQTRPALIVVNEACWLTPRRIPEREAAHRLSQLCGVRYEIFTGTLERSYTPPALLWDTDRLRLTEFSDERSDHHRWGHNAARMASLNSTHADLRVLMAHFDYASGQRRLMEAQTLAAQVRPGHPVLVAGDLNATASGPHLPARDWARVPVHQRHHKGRQLTDGTFVTDTRALDTLIGVWDAQAGTRRGGVGLRALAEADWDQQGRPAHGLAPTVYEDEPLLIDWLLATPDIDLVPDTYRVWEGEPHHTDHTLITATIRLPRRRTVTASAGRASAPVPRIPST